MKKHNWTRAFMEALKAVENMGKRTTKREERLANGLKVLHEYAQDRRAKGKECNAVFVERCAYTHLRESA